MDTPWPRGRRRGRPKLWGGETPEAPSGVAPGPALGRRRRLRPKPLRQRKQGLPGAGFCHPPSPGAPLQRTWKSGLLFLPPPGDSRLPPSLAAPPIPTGHAPGPGLAPPLALAGGRSFGAHPPAVDVEPHWGCEVTFPTLSAPGGGERVLGPL